MEISMPNIPIPGIQAAIHAGINCVLNEDGTDFQSQGLAMVSKAQERVESLIKCNSSSTSMGQLISENMDLIKFTMRTVVIAYQAMSDHMSKTTDQRKRLEEELELHMATFTIPGDIESKNLSTEHQAIDGFMEKLEAYPQLLAFSGLKKIFDKEQPKTRHYCALPLYSINQIEHPSASPRDLDQARIANHAFFNSKAINTMLNMCEHFRTDNGAVIFFESIYQRQNYLNNVRAPRLILTMLFNILWNLQHPVNCKTGFSMSLNDCIKLCSKFNEFLNSYLGDRTCKGPYQINSSINGLLRLTKMIETRTTKLLYGFLDEKLRQFNLKDLTNHAHHTLRELDTSLFQLIFKKKSRVTRTKNPDQRAALDIADTISYFNDLLDKNNLFFKFFDKYREHLPDILLAHTYLNHEAITVIDALIIFSHLTGKQREQFITEIREMHDGGEDSISFADELYFFNKHYIVPLETPLTESLISTHSDPAIKAKLLALILIPLFTLTVADFRIKVDTTKSLSRVKETTDENGISPFYLGIEQVQLINITAQEHSENLPNFERAEYFYHWSISPYLVLTHQAARAIDSLPSKQYRMTQITELLDYISELTLSYKSFLQYKSFQAFLLDCLQLVDAEYRKFAEETTRVEHILSSDGKLDRTLKSVLLTMTRELSDNLIAFRQTIDDISHIVSAPDFTELRKQELDKHIKKIETQFVQLFNRPPVNFINTCQQILSRNDVATIHTDRQDKTRQLYAFALNFFNEANAALIASKPELPPSPHFLSKLKKDKIDKYLKLIQNSIEHITQLQTDGNFLLDKYELIDQLSQITEDKTLSRTEEEIRKSTYCQVVVEELNARIQQQIAKKRLTAANSAATTQARPTEISAVASGLQHVPARSSSARLSSSRRPSPEEDVASIGDRTPSMNDRFRLGSSTRLFSFRDDSREQKMHATFAIFKADFKRVLQFYLTSKEAARSTNWFNKILRAILNWLGKYSIFIHMRLQETKIKVVKKILDSIGDTPKATSINLSPVRTPDTRLKLTHEEMETLSHGRLGNKTLFFREHQIWANFADVHEAVIGLDH
jgi:hypothetical protein